MVYSTRQSAQGHHRTPAHDSEKPLKAVLSNPIMPPYSPWENEHTPFVPREQEHFVMDSLRTEVSDLPWPLLGTSGPERPRTPQGETTASQSGHLLIHGWQRASVRYALLRSSCVLYASM